MFLDVSEIGTMCDEAGVHKEIVRGIAATGVYDGQIIVEELLKNASTEAASESSAVWSKDGVRLYIIDQTENQVGSWMDGIGVKRTCRSVREDRIKDQVGRDLGVSLSDLEPEPKIGERFFVGLVG